jgi:hypothetical protein
MMKKITLLLFLLTASFGFSQNTVTVDVSKIWKSYMNWFDNPADTTPDCTGGFCDGNGWSIANLKTTIGASNITLQPNYSTYAGALIGDNNARNYWTNSSDGGVTAGPLGNKMMEASTFVEPGATFNGQDLTFTGNVLSNNIVGVTAEFFIKALDPNNNYADALNGTKTLALPASGTFTVTATAAQLTAGLIVQYGFRVYGLNKNPANEVANGSVVAGPVSLGTKDFKIAGLNIYPNPAQDSWTVKTSNINMSAIKVFDVLGKNVLSLKPNASEVTINASSLKSGLYFARINTLNGSSSLKLIKN